MPKRSRNQSGSYARRRREFARLDSMFPEDRMLATWAVEITSEQTNTTHVRTVSNAAMSLGMLKKDLITRLVHENGNFRYSRIRGNKVERFFVRSTSLSRSST